MRFTNDETMYKKLRQPELFLDRCHKYGWIISLIGTIVSLLVFYSYSAGQFTRGVEAMRYEMQTMKEDFNHRMDRVEKQVDSLSNKK